jgi:hypothetical protein
MSQRVRAAARISLSIVTLAVIALAAQAGQRWPWH